MKEARKYHKMLREWVTKHVTKHGSINLPHKLLILDAEELSLSFRDYKGTKHEGGVEVSRRELKAAYDKAIVAAMKSGFTQYAALPAHLASETFSGGDGDLFWERARGFYLQWGATRVVRYVEEEQEHQPVQLTEPEFSSISFSTSSPTPETGFDRTALSVPELSSKK
jgi:hypothetical protein